VSARPLPWWPALLVALLGLGLLYGGALRTGFLCDDFLFLEEARRQPLGSSLVELGPLGNYYRPLSRQIYFELLTPFAPAPFEGGALVFHFVNAALFVAALALVVELLLVWLPPAGAMAGALYFALLPMQRVNLTWVSCSQDLLALVFTLLAFRAFRHGRDGWGAVAYLGAMASKETAFPLPLALAAWMALRPAPQTEGRTGWRRLAPYLVVGALWMLVALWIRSRHPAAAGFLRFGPEPFVAALVHGVQSLLGLDHPAGWARGMLENGPAWLALAAFAALAFWIRGAGPADGADAGRALRPVALFALAWFVVFSLPIGPVVHTWSAYFYTLAAVGGAILAGTAFRRIGRIGWIALTTVLLWWHAGSSGPAIAVTDDPWGWTSHLTASYFERGAELSGRLARGLRRIDPSPAPGTRFFFATLPSHAAFQMGNGALIRELYRDTTLASYFYSQFSDSTAGSFPARFLHWDGAAFVPLYDNAESRWFQVGSDLLLMDRPAGAAHALRRAVAAGEAGPEHFYWLGWAELWRGRRAAAEAAWQAFGAADDPARYHAALVAGRDALLAGDSTAARRRLFEAIRAGVGRWEAHGALGELLENRSLKYALLEYRVAVHLNPRDVRARRRLVLGLIAVRLDDAARREIEALDRSDPTWRSDTALVAARQALAARSPDAAAVVEIEPEGRR
jgi:hypothetical protein